MAKLTRVLDFYTDLLLELSAWAKEQSAGDETLAQYGEQMFQTLSAGERTLPTEGLQAIFSALPSFTDRFPQRRTIISHLEKYLATVLRSE